MSTRLDPQMVQLAREFARVKEKVETLTAERGNADRTNSSVLRSELQPLASLATKMKSAQITGSPSTADYNNLQADVEAIYGAFVLISNLLGNARLPGQ